MTPQVWHIDAGWRGVHLSTQRSVGTVSVIDNLVIGDVNLGIIAVG